MKAYAKHTITKDKPFVRAEIDVYGDSEQSALDRLKSLLAGIEPNLPDDCTIWDPKYRGFAADEEGHQWTVVITLGLDKEETEKLIAQKVGSCR